MQGRGHCSQSGRSRGDSLNVRLVSGVGQSCGTELLPVGSLGRGVRIKLNCRALAGVTGNGSVWGTYAHGWCQKRDCGSYVTCSRAFTAHKAGPPTSAPPKTGSWASWGRPCPWARRGWSLHCEMVIRTSVKEALKDGNPNPGLISQDSRLPGPSANLHYQHQ